MKVSKLLSLDYELVSKLKEEENASALVNQLISNHYKDPRTEEEIIADVKNKIKDKNDKIKHDIDIEERIKQRTEEMKKNKHKVNFKDVEKK